LDLIHTAIDVVLHLDQHLNVWATDWGTWTYAILFLIIFAETGLVVTPFLPGDSLLFAVGALTTVDHAYLQLALIAPLLIAAALLGDNVNYFVGRKFGRRAFSESSRWFNRDHLNKTQEYYDRHGGKTIIIARFIPIVRTFAPFVAGIGQMAYRKFISFSIFGALFWVLGFLFAGHFFGDLPSVKQNFHIVILAIIAISVMPAVIEVIRARSRVKN
jgi:membrane-associated protein